MAVALARKTTQTAISQPGSFIGSRSGLAYTLGQQIGAGGNGVVYTISRRPELVAKVQKQPLSQTDIAKLEALIRGATPELLSVAAWPMDGLKSTTGQVVGFVMPRLLDARPLYELYSPRSRVQHFPSADFRFLVHVAANVARLFAAVHKAGFICGDVNHSNILVRQSGTVAAVDCDSFQVGDGSRFPCLVGTDLFVPPELMGTALNAGRRTANHDAFGLAVLVFHLLFMGRHPFAGRFLGKGDMPIERAIAECRFAYSAEALRTEMAAPPFTPPMEVVGQDVRELFERAFHPHGRSGGRPTPEQWIDALDSLKSALLSCRNVPWHHHPQAMGTCPWCAIEGSARTKLFGGLVKITTSAIADFEMLWARYLALAEPPPSRPLPNPAHWKPRPQPKQNRPSVFSRIRLDRVIAAGALVLFAISCIGAQASAISARIMLSLKSALDGVQTSATAEVALRFAILIPLVAPPLTQIFAAAFKGLSRVIMTPGGGRPSRAEMRARQREAERAWLRAASAWQAQPPPPDVSDLRPPIEALKKDLDALASEREAKLCAGAAPIPENEQRSRYLAGFRIEDAKLPNIGPARCAVLRSWGIDTAADVEEAKINEIPGFGRSLTDKIVSWRERTEQAFVYSATPTIDPLVAQRIDRRLAIRRTALMKELRERIAEVEHRVSGHMKMRQALWAEVESAFEAKMTSTPSRVFLHFLWDLHLKQARFALNASSCRSPRSQKPSMSVSLKSASA